jgi:hypothetical protein
MRDAREKSDSGGSERPLPRWRASAMRSRIMALIVRVVGLWARGADPVSRPGQGKGGWAGFEGRPAHRGQPALGLGTCSARPCTQAIAGAWRAGA